jgi:hypothetical protein
MAENDVVVEFLKTELVRVQNERDAAQANERQQLQVVAELRQQVGLLMATTYHAWEAANNDEHLHADGFEKAIESAAESEARILKINQTRAVV